jgi:hypothetical protein
VVEALRYEPEGRGSDSSLDHLNFFLFLNLSGRIIALISTQPLTGISTKGISWE